LEAVLIPGLKKKKIIEIENSIIAVNKLLEAAQKKTDRWGWIRFSVFITGIILLFSALYAGNELFMILVLALFIPLFVFVSIIQSRLIATVNRQKKWIEIKKSHIARIKLDWDNIPPSKSFGSKEVSPLEGDLDLTGSRSLHQLIDYSKTGEGSSLLREFFISHPKDAAVVIKRQNIIKELLKLSHFREKFLLAGALSPGREINTSEVNDWLIRSERGEEIKKVIKYLFPLCLINLFVISLSIAGIFNALWGITSFVYVSVYFLNQRKIGSTARDAEVMNENLSKVIGMLSFIENYNFKGYKNLEELSSPLKNKKVSPTKELNKINSYINLLSLRGNPIVWGVFILVFPFDYYLAYKIEMRKKEISQHLDEWLEIWHRFEAYVSLSVFASLNPEYNFPSIIAEGKNGVNINAEEMGHPLIIAERKECNSYSLAGIGRLSLITGSNMSGKSTFLRTIGINLCMAYSGAPVNAARFTAGITRLFTCIKVSDSVIDGISYFYAEVKRLKTLLDEIEKEEELPVLYLIDEIFKGTNNIERLQGSMALIKALALKNGSGLISTHDLELIKLSKDAKSISNFHFKEEIKEGKMLFDYKLCGGPCPTTNALIIMKNNGLPVE
jgi:hypothetical protein